MARFLGIWLAVVLLWPSLFVEARVRRKRQEKWTEEDEARRIEQIKNAERMEYQTEQSLDYGQQSLDYGQQLLDRGQKSLDRGQKSHVPVPEGKWCYHCASPMDNVNEDMRQAIHNFFFFRRTEYPSKVVHRDCTEPSSLASLSKQPCGHSYCETLQFTDRDTGSLFTIRGCAEKFGAINEEVLNQRGDNTCHRVHPKLEIGQECICRNRKYCFPGPDRKSVSSKRAPLSSILAIFALMVYRFM